MKLNESHKAVSNKDLMKMSSTNLIGLEGLTNLFKCIEIFQGDKSNS